MNTQAPDPRFQIHKVKGGWRVGPASGYLNEFKTKRAAETYRSEAIARVEEVEAYNARHRAHLESFGPEIRPADIRPGDVIWYQSGGPNSWHGYTVVVRKVNAFEHGGAQLFFDPPHAESWGHLLFSASTPPRMVRRASPC